MNPQDPRETGVDRKRSEKDEVPEHESGEDALAWMEGKLDGSWVDAVTGDPKEKGTFEVLPEVDTNDQASIDAMFKMMLGQ